MLSRRKRNQHTAPPSSPTRRSTPTPADSMAGRVPSGQQTRAMEGVVYGRQKWLRRPARAGWPMSEGLAGGMASGVGRDKMQVTRFVCQREIHRQARQAQRLSVGWDGARLAVRGSGTRVGSRATGRRQTALELELQRHLRPTRALESPHSQSWCTISYQCRLRQLEK